MTNVVCVSHERRVTKFDFKLRLQFAFFFFKSNLICCTGIGHKKVTQFAASIKSCKPLEVYKRKDIQYRNEILHKKTKEKTNKSCHIFYELI